MTVIEKTETEALFNIDKPSLHALSYVLRHPDTWPEGFVWDYSQCNQCAMGLAAKLWGLTINPDGTAVNQNSSAMARFFGMPFKTAMSIFFDAQETLPRLFYLFPVRSRDDVTPDDVADMIDKYLEIVE